MFERDSDEEKLGPKSKQSKLEIYKKIFTLEPLVTLNAELKNYIDLHGSEQPITFFPAFVNKYTNQILKYVPGVRTNQIWARDANILVERALLSSKKDTNSTVVYVATALAGLKEIHKVMLEEGVKKGEVLTAIQTAISSYEKKLTEHDLSADTEAISHVIKYT